MEGFIKGFGIFSDGFADLWGIDFLLFEELEFEDFVLFRGVMISEPFKEEDESIFPGTNGGEEVLDIFLKFFMIFIFRDLLWHLNNIYEMRNNIQRKRGWLGNKNVNYIKIDIK